MKIADNTLVLLISDNGGEDRNFAHAELKAIASGLDQAIRCVREICCGGVYHSCIRYRL